MKNVFFIFLFMFNYTLAQQINWTEITNKYNLPNGIKVFEGTRQSPILKAYYIDVDMSNKNLAVRPYISTTSMSVQNFTTKVGAYAAINGGFFGGSTSYSAVIYPNEVKAINVQSVTRNLLNYPVIRSLFSMNNDRSFNINWIYQFGNTLSDIYSFPQPLNYTNNDPTPKPVPLKSNGTQMQNVLVAIGGAPTLVKNGKANITYNEEIMWGSGVGLDNQDPRSAVGYTANNHVILFVADGRQLNSNGVSLPELANIMISLGCIEAMNLDGGGSTQLAVQNKYINNPSEQRAVPSILAIVHADSLNLPQKPTFEKVIDTSDSNATAFGGGWFESANPGFYGNSKSLLHSVGNGEAYYEFRLHLPKETIYNVYGWWVSSSNRSSDTPFIIFRKNGIDTIKVDQTANGSTWKFIGKFTFTGTDNDKVIISNKAKTNNYVVADAIKIESFDKNITSIFDKDLSFPSSFKLEQNYPNPFNPNTIIEYTIPSNLEASYMTYLRVYDILGNEISTLVKENQKPGIYRIYFNTQKYKLSSGVYFYQLKVFDNKSTNPIYLQTKKMILMR